jgi:hypothetical protein
VLWPYGHPGISTPESLRGIESSRILLWPYGHPGISTPESLRGIESLRILPSVLPATHLQEVPVGFHRFEPVE